MAREKNFKRNFKNILNKKDYFTQKMILKNHKRREKEEKKKQKDKKKMSHQFVKKQHLFRYIKARE